MCQQQSGGWRTNKTLSTDIRKTSNRRKEDSEDETEWNNEVDSCQINQILFLRFIPIFLYFNLLGFASLEATCYIMDFDIHLFHWCYPPPTPASTSLCHYPWFLPTPQIQANESSHCLSHSPNSLFPIGQNAHPVIKTFYSKYCDLNSLSQQIAGILCCNLTVLQRIYGQSVLSCRQHWQESLLRWWWLLHVGNQIMVRSFIKYALVLMSNVRATTTIQQGTFSPWYQEGDLESWEVGLQFCQQYTVCAVLFFFPLFNNRNKKQQQKQQKSCMRAALAQLQLWKLLGWREG